MDLAIGEAVLDGEHFYTGIVRDITERKGPEGELTAKEAQLRMVLDNMPGAIWVIDEDMDLVLANDM